MKETELLLGHLALFVGQAVDSWVLATLERSGFSGLRVSHGYVVQRLLTGPQSVTTLAKDLGVTQQAASKVVAHMAALGLVVNVASDDARQRRIALSARGQATVTAARRARARVEHRLEQKLTAKRKAAAEQVLREALELLGGTQAVRQRRVRPPLELTEPRLTRRGPRHERRSTER